MHKSKLNYYEEILSIVLLALLRRAVTNAQLSATIQRATRAAKSRAAASKLAPTDNVTARLANALYAWHHDHRFLTPSGKPRALKLRGSTHSIEVLLRGEGVFASSERSLLALKRLGLLRHRGQGRYVPADDIVSLAAIDPYLAEHVCSSVARLLSTVDFNLKSKRGDRLLVERAAAIHDLPLANLREFQDFANQQCRQAVENVNDWLESRRTRSHARHGRPTPVIAAGVHVFAFVGDGGRGQALTRSTPSAARRAARA